MTEHYCYHCQAYHPEAEMRQIPAGGRLRWRCIKSIEAVKRPQAARDAFGQTITARNRADAEAFRRRWEAND